jgi:hypothetical protein
MTDWIWWKFEDVKSIFHINAKKSIPYKDFLLANVDWAEWPGGAAEIESAFHTQLELLKEAREEAAKWKEEYLNASKDAMDFAGKIEKANEDAWQRVAHGSVDWEPDSIFNNSMMFDYPRYSWLELQDLIKGIKR